MLMCSISTYLYGVAQKCRLWSRTTIDLTAARELRLLAEELDQKAMSWRDMDCNEHIRSGASPDKPTE
jgi:hypothetical protein